jgi:hypothetical protein
MTKETYRSRRPNAVPALVGAGCLVSGIEVLFEVKTAAEGQWVTPWLAEDRNRRRAIWLNERVEPLLWAYDGHRYSPTGLSKRIWDLSGLPASHQPSPNTGGPWRWIVPDENGLSLWEIAIQVQDGKR